MCSAQCHHTKCYLQMYLDPDDHYRITSNGKKVLLLKQKILVNSFIVFDCAGSLSLRGLSSSCSDLGLLLSCNVSGFSQWLLLIAVASLVPEHRLWSSQASVVAARGLSGCGTWTSLPRDIRDLPRPGSKPVSPALRAGFFTTESSGKSPKYYH